MEKIHSLLIVLLLLSSFLVFLSENPVHSVLFLILSFFNAASILILFNADFLGLLFIIIYVGAIAVLFLFVVMMLNIKNIKVSSNINFLYIPFLLLFNIIFIIKLFFYLNDIFSSLQYSFFINELSLSDSYIEILNTIVVFGQVLYNYYLVCFLLAGFILLVAMLGAILLTFNFKSARKNELVFKQLSRSDNFLSFFK
jgi:NADH-quinone oxidoreductase subunit J